MQPPIQDERAEKILAEAKKRLEPETKVPGVQIIDSKPEGSCAGTARPVEKLRPLPEKPVFPISRDLLDFRKQYTRDPASTSEFEGFKKRGW